VIKNYAAIDAYSQGNLQTVDCSARNMGKNDLWIAATASAFDLVLLTTDKDFSHLDEAFIQLEYISIEEMKRDNR
jgi:predicted nucleic acid-binding protein